eukprot:5609206-Prymnesium_polylepis.1
MEDSLNGCCRGGTFVGGCLEHPDRIGEHSYVQARRDENIGTWLVRVNCTQRRAAWLPNTSLTRGGFSGPSQNSDAA